MPQFGVHRNASRVRGHVPYLIVIQNGRFDIAATRLVAGLTSRVSLDLLRDYKAAPEFVVEGRPVVLSLVNVASVPLVRLGPIVARFVDEDSRMKIQRAHDEFLSQA